MTQINIRIDEEADEILSVLAALRKIPKTMIAREFMLEGMNQKLFPDLLEWYQKGQLTLKKLIAMSHLSPHEIFQKLAESDLEPPIPERVDDYTASIRELLEKAYESGNISFKVQPPSHEFEEPLQPEDFEEEK